MAAEASSQWQKLPAKLRVTAMSNVGESSTFQRVTPTWAMLVTAA
jgi:hypothetical protein